MTSIPSLDEIVREALEFFIKTPPPPLDISQFSLPLVVGSGNAFNTGKIIFSGKSAIFADESNYKTTLDAYAPVIEKGLISDAVIISASGEKDSVWEVEVSKSVGLKTTLLTCSPTSSAAKIADSVVTYESIAEPYTYNTSTYLGMIISTTKEEPRAMKEAIDALAIPDNFAEYTAYAFVLPDRFIDIAPMVIIKRDELFGPHVQIRAYTEGHARHAKFVHPWEKELVISLGARSTYFGYPHHRWEIPLSPVASFGTVIAVSYYLCGCIQKAKPSYFAEHIAAYCSDYGPKAYGKSGVFDVIVPPSRAR